jgi:iron complex outermembrane recepter protein
MKKLSLLLVFFFSAVIAIAQTGEVSGVVKDKSTGETMIGVAVTYAPGKGVVTDINGNFSLKLDHGPYELTFSYAGFVTEVRAVTISNKPVYLTIALGGVQLNEVEVVADIAIERETPVAFINVGQVKLAEQGASQDIPMILNSTPGVYATQQGGGDGDARITIRGFNQRNVAVMVDGVPMNDMENGWVYWSNWFGLDNATRTIQVQRGLGASKLAIPAVGGSINIITKGIDEKKGLMVKQEVGSDGLLRSTATITSGKLKNGFGITAAGSYKQSDGYVDQTWSRMYFYFLKVEKRLGNHMLSISAMGAPQRHAQRSYKKSIATYSHKYARGLFEGSDEVYAIYQMHNQDQINDSAFYAMLSGHGIDQQEADELAVNFIDTTGIRERGYTFNENWGYVIRSREGDSASARPEVLNEKLNYFHKPVVNLKHFWMVNEKVYISNIVYASYGRGGGTGLASSTSVPIDPATGQYDFIKAYNNNAYNPANAYKGEQRSTAYLRSSVNNHEWYGLLSTSTWKAASFLDVSGGIDLRMYRGQHYQEVYDLLGGDIVYPDNSDKTTSNKIKRLGDKVNFHNDGLVRWGGAFAMAEYKQKKWTGFISLSGSYSGYKRIDYFKKKDIVLADTVMLQAVDFNDTVVYNGNAYHIDSPEARYSETEWKYIPGFTVKGGANYNLNEKMNVFMNLGYLSRSPRFDNVIDRNNQFFRDIKNEIVRAVELGYAYGSQKFSGNVNTYFTYWQNKPLDAAITVVIDGDNYKANVNGISARHTGVETDFAWRIRKNLTLEGMISIGDWIWDSKDTALIFDDDQNLLAKVSYDAKGVHVGDAAQQTYAASVRYEIIKNLYVKPQYMFFAKNFSNFDPVTLDGPDAGRESWQLPNYGLLEFHAGYKYVWKKAQFDLRGSLLNALNTMFIADANNNDSFSTTTSNFDAASAGVFFGLGRRFTTSLTITF